MATGRPRALTEARNAARAPRDLLLMAFGLACLACPSPPLATETMNVSASEPGRACAVLRGLTQRAQACRSRPQHRIPALASLASLTEDDCIAIMRTVTRTNAKPPKVSSVYTHRKTEPLRPLADGEADSWESFQLSAHVTILPDLAPLPGRPLLEVFLDGVKIRGTTSAGLDAVNQTPGTHDLVLRHAGVEQAYCLSLKECALVILQAHGSALAPNDTVTKGHCEKSG